jgi:hypothetical protein
LTTWWHGGGGVRRCPLGLDLGPFGPWRVSWSPRIDEVPWRWRRYDGSIGGCGVSTSLLQRGSGGFMGLFGLGEATRALVPVCYRDGGGGSFLWHDYDAAVLGSLSPFHSYRPCVDAHSETTRMAQDHGGACWWAASWVEHYISSRVVVFSRVRRNPYWLVRHQHTDPCRCRSFLKGVGCTPFALPYA